MTSRLWVRDIVNLVLRDSFICTIICFFITHLDTIIKVYSVVTQGKACSRDFP